MSTIHEAVDGILDDLLERPVIHYGRLEYTSEKFGDTSEHHFVSLDGVMWKEIDRKPEVGDYADIKAIMEQNSLSATRGFLLGWGAKFELVR